MCNMTVCLFDGSFRLLITRVKAFLDHICPLCLGTRTRWFLTPLYCYESVIGISHLRHSTVDWTSSSKKVLLYTWNSLNVSYKWNPNLHIPYFWSEFPGRNLTHPAANVYEMCLYACMEVPLVSRYNGRSPSRLHVPTLLCILTDLLWDVQKM